MIFFILELLGIWMSFKRISGVIVANRLEDSIKDVEDRVYTRDIFGGDS